MDGLFGVALTQRVGQWSFDSSVLYTAFGAGTQDTEFGDRMQYSAAISYRVAGMGAASGAMFNGSKPHAHGADAHGNVHIESAGPALDLILELNGEWHGTQ